jgi:outer membrane protein
MRTPFLAAAFLALVAAAPAPARAEQKLGFVDLQRALNEVDEGKAAKASLKREFDEKQKTLDQKKTDFEQLRGAFEKQSSVMSDDARKEKQGELERKGMELQATYMQMQKELSERERETTRGIFEKMNAIVREIAEADGLSAVVQAEALVYAAPSLDITNELVRKYNARHKGAAAPTAAVKPAAAAKPAAGGDKKAPAKKEKQ